MPLPTLEAARQAASAELPAVASFHLLDVPVAWADTPGRLLGANAAFEAATGQHAAGALGRPLVELLGLADATGGARAAADPASAAAARQLGERLASDAPFAPLPLAGRRADGLPLVGWLGQRHAGGLRVLTLQVAGAGATPARLSRPAAAPARSGLHHAAELLAMAQSLGGFGVWTHDLRSGESHWDGQMWPFFGRPSQAGTLPPDALLHAVHPDDREAALRAGRGSIERPGRHAHRFRLGDAEGRYRHVRAVWEVQAGADGRALRAQGMLLDDTETVRLAQSVDAAHAQLNLAITLANIGIWQHDLATDRVQANDRGWSLLGLPPQPQGMALAALAALLHPEDLAPLQQQLQREGRHRQGPDPARAELPIDLGARGRHADGRWRYLLTRRVPQRNSAGALVGHVGVVLDLTERNDEQQRALALAQRLEMATAAAGVGVWNALLTEPPVVHWDEQMRALHGLAPDQPAPGLADYLARHVHPDDRRAVVDSLALLLKRREGLLDMDLRILGPDGLERRLATRSSISGERGRRHLHGVMLDVTERHATEQRLRQAHERAVLAARGAGIGTWESDVDASLGWWDEQMFRLRGREPRTGPVPAAEMQQWLHPADREQHVRHMRAALDSDGQTNQEFRVVWPDGSVRWLASRSTPVHDENGRSVRRIGINWDVTDARNAAAARADRLLAQRESQAKSRFLARISHELRTPLNAVLGFSQLLLAETRQDAAPDPATWRRRVEHVLASGEHLLALIDDVLELSSLESGELPLSLQPVALANLAQTSLPLVELLAREHGVSLHLGAIEGWALADPVRLRQVLLNLLSNAIKYNRRGGQVTISSETSGAWLLLRVADTGRGLSPVQLRHLFEPFNRLGADREGISGTGIGLAIVQASVQHMGGTVSVQSTLGEGSCFELGLQLAQRPRPAPVTIEMGLPLPPLPLPQGGRLLYIEDNEVNLLIVSELVRQRADLQFFAAADGASGLATARAEQPVLILVDMQLPDMDGLEVLRRLRADPATAEIRCIALSANAIPEDIRRARAAGFDDYWTKPLDLKAFTRALDALFGGAAG